MERMRARFSKNIQKIIILLTILTVLFVLVIANILTYNSSALAENSKNSGYCSMDARTEKVYFASNENVRLPMASTTKIMTALVTIENVKLDEKVKIPRSATGIEGSSVYLKEGEVLTVEELLYCLMLRSGNDAATALALFVAGSVDDFVTMMNITAERLELNNTHFANPHGLHDENHYTTAYDLCKLACFCMNNNEFKRIVSTKNVRVGQGESSRYLINKNKTLNSYRGGNGVKTGFTKKAGRCLVAASERENTQVVAVALNTPDMFEVCYNLMDKTFVKIREQNA